MGKRPRLPMKRTTSMTEITADLSTGSEAQAVDPRNPFSTQRKPALGYGLEREGGDGFDQRLLGMNSPRSRRHSADYVETAHFLRACSLCKRRLVPSRDIYMYRGDSAFCSLECRQQQMNQDERKEKCALASKMETGAPSSAGSTTGETVAAV